MEKPLQEGDMLTKLATVKRNWQEKSSHPKEYLKEGEELDMLESKIDHHPKTFEKILAELKEGKKKKDEEFRKEAVDKEQEVRENDDYEEADEEEEGEEEVKEDGDMVPPPNGAKRKTVTAATARRPQEDLCKDVQQEREPQEVFFWQQRGETLAKSLLSLKTCRPEIIHACSGGGEEQQGSSD